ncbi:hypothetical protein BASA61_004737 [Batrachochytrium salamandrivorans]|nr:hypothetical protein BASA61_004737 [Batrachochytrium salamandrivorans]
MKLSRKTNIVLHTVPSFVRNRTPAHPNSLSKKNGKRIYDIGNQPATMFEYSQMDPLLNQLQPTSVNSTVDSRRKRQSLAPLDTTKLNQDQSIYHLQGSGHTAPYFRSPLSASYCSTSLHLLEKQLPLSLQPSMHSIPAHSPISDDTDLFNSGEFTPMPLSQCGGMDNNAFHRSNPAVQEIGSRKSELQPIRMINPFGQEIFLNPPQSASTSIGGYVAQPKCVDNTISLPSSSKMYSTATSPFEAFVPTTAIDSVLDIAPAQLYDSTQLFPLSMFGNSPIYDSSSGSLLDQIAKLQLSNDRVGRNDVGEPQISLSEFQSSVRFFATSDPQNSHQQADVQPHYFDSMPYAIERYSTNDLHSSMAGIQPKTQLKVPVGTRDPFIIDPIADWIKTSHYAENTDLQFTQSISTLEKQPRSSVNLAPTLPQKADPALQQQNSAHINARNVRPSFLRAYDLRRHWSRYHFGMPRYACGKCGRTFQRNDALLRHQSRVCALLTVDLSKATLASVEDAPPCHSWSGIPTPLRSTLNSTTSSHGDLG